MPVGAGNQIKASTKLQKLVSLPRSSENHEKELLLLAETVHCHNYRRDPYLGHRVDEWKAALSLEGNGIGPDAAVDVRISKLFREVSVRCVGTNSDNEACRYEMGGRKVQNCSKTIQEIAKPEIYSDNVVLEYFLQVLSENMYCHVHKSQSSKQVKIWMSLITKIRDVEGSEPSLMTDDKGHLTPDLAQANLASTRVSNPDIVDSSLCNRSTPVPRNLRSVPPAEYWPELYDTTPFRTLRTITFCTQRMWREQVIRPLQKADRAAGFLYAYEVDGNKGFVKIGYTTRSIKERLDKWSFDCNRLSKPIYPIASNVSVAVPNAARVEKLCHVELKRHMVRIYCNGCLKAHKEWFQISPSEAISVLEKWSRWMRSHPYQPRSIDSSNKWTLRPEEEQRSKDFARFMMHL